MFQRSQERLSPTEYAKKLLAALNIRDVPIYPRKIAKEMGIFVWERESDSGCDGYLICANGVWGIMINRLIKSRERKRFTVAHELGHYIIDYHNITSHQCLSKNIGIVSSSTRRDEKEANEFAVELLMPGEFFKEDIRQGVVSLETIKSLANKYKTSMISTAIRYVQLSEDICAVVISEKGRIKYFAYSESFKRGKYLCFSRNAPLRDGCYAKRLFNEGFQIPEMHGEVLTGSWSANADDPKITMLEQSRCLPKFNQVLSLIRLEKKSNILPIAHVIVE